MLAIIKALVTKFAAGFISKVVSFKGSSTDESKSTQSVLGNSMLNFIVGLSLGLVIGCGVSYYLHCNYLLEVEYEYKDAAVATQNELLEKAHAEAVKLEEAVVQVRADYDRLGAELVRLRIENAALRGDASAGAASECSQELAKREDLLLRMASLGLRTSEAVAEKQAALKNCVGTYDSLKAQ